MCQSKEQGGRRCAGALTRQRDKKALTTAEKRYQETGVASLTAPLPTSLGTGPISLRSVVDSS